MLLKLFSDIVSLHFSSLLRRRQQETHSKRIIQVRGGAVYSVQRPLARSESSVDFSSERKNSEIWLEQHFRTFGKCTDFSAGLKAALVRFKIFGDNEIILSL